MDIDLVVRAQRGDKEAYADLAFRIADRFLAVARRNLRDIDLAEDATQQSLTDATAPVDVTVGGYAGKAITLHVPLSYDLPNATREDEFAKCDEGSFAFYGVGDEAIARDAQGPVQIDELWILDVDGSIVILDAAYSPATPADIVGELRALAESANFEAP